MSVDAPVASVIMIVKNGACYMREALASVAGTRFGPIEIIVLDGGSTDGSAEIAQSMPEVTFRRQRSRGIASAYNEAIASARSGIVAFLSADDLWLPGKLDRHLQRLAERQDLLVTVSMVQHFLDGEKPANFRGDLLTRAVPGLFMEALVARREVFERVGPFDPSFTTAEDTDWFARARDLGVEIDVLPHVLVRKRVHGANSSLGDAEGDRHRLRALHASLQRKRKMANDRRF